MYPTLSQLVSIEMMNIILLSRGEVRSWWNATQGRIICKNNKKEERKGCVHKQSVCKTYPKGHRQQILHRNPEDWGQSKRNRIQMHSARSTESSGYTASLRSSSSTQMASPSPSSSAMRTQPLSVPGTVDDSVPSWTLRALSLAFTTSGGQGFAELAGRWL